MAVITFDENFHRIIPSNWDQLSKKDVSILIETTVAFKFAIRSKLEILLHFLKMDIGVDTDSPGLYKLSLKKTKQSYLVTKDQLFGMIQTLDFLFSENDGKVTLSSNLRKNLYPFFFLHNIKYIGPDSGLTNITFKEWIESEKHYVNFVKTKDIGHLDLLIATLYRPKSDHSDDLDRDPRITFNEKSTPLRSIMLSHLDYKIKYTILFFYEGSRNFIIKIYKNVYSEFSDQIDNEKNIFGMANVIEAMTNDDPTKFDAVENTELFKVLLGLENRIIRANNLKSK